LGRALEELGTGAEVHVATKVRLMGEDLDDLRGAVWRSLEASLERLRLSQVTLLQLHNSITARRGDEPTSVTPQDVLSTGGIAEAFEAARQAGLVRHVGLTGIGQPAALREVLASRRFETMQTPYHLLNPSAGRAMDEHFAETNYGNIIAAAAQAGMGVLAIRVFAGGALTGRPPSPHTLKTPFFPLALFDRDQNRARRLQEKWGPDRPIAGEAIPFVLAHHDVATALIGFGDVWEVEQAVQALTRDMPPPEWDDIRRLATATFNRGETISPPGPGG
jgi:aryl-alcohol dehydrogenase-like predicted oxidoreductase